MANDPTLEIPGELRSIAEVSVEQARKAFDGFLTAAYKAIDDSEHRYGSAHERAREFGRRTVGFADANIAAGFEFATRLASARTLDDWVKLQSDFAVEQARRFSEQTKALGEGGIGVPAPAKKAVLKRI